jgi:hypothetical protein
MVRSRPNGGGAQIVNIEAAARRRRLRFGHSDGRVANQGIGPFTTRITTVGRASLIVDELLLTASASPRQRLGDADQKPGVVGVP